MATWQEALDHSQTETEHDTWDHSGLTGVGGSAPSSQLTAASVNASSSTLTAKTGGPAVTVTIGASGEAMVNWGARIVINSATTTRLATMSIDMSGANTGNIPGPTVNLRNSPATSFQDKHATAHVTGLTPGSTTFTALYACTTDNADFSERVLIVTPI